MKFFDRFKRGIKASEPDGPEYADAPPQIINLQYGSYEAFGGIAESDIVQACLAANARHSAKARARVIRMSDSGIVADAWNTKLERMLNQNPNPQMTGYQFLFNTRSLCDEKGMALIYVDRDARYQPIAFYPVYYDSIYALVDPEDRRFLRGFQVYWGGKEFKFLLRDLVVLYKGLMRGTFYGKGNGAIYHSLDMIHTTDNGTKSAIRLASSLRGVLKHTKGMISDEDLRASRDRFMETYVSSGGNGIAATDSTYDFTPITFTPHTVNAAVVQSYEKRVMRFFGVNDSILMGDYTEDKWTSYYEGSIEPFLVNLSQGMTNACFTPTERAFRNEIVYESNRLLYASAQTKLQLAALVDRGLMTPNEFREMFAFPPADGGDEFVIRKEYTARGNLDTERE